MKRIFFVFIISFMIGSCNNQDVHIKKELIDELSSGDFKLPSKYGNLLLFVHLDNHEIVNTNIDILHSVYVGYYSSKFADFKSFLVNALEQNLVLNQIEFGDDEKKMFTVNNAVKDFYSKNSMRVFLNFYCFKQSAKEYVVKEKYQNAKQLYSVLYIAFINNYKIYVDDYAGKYIIRDF